MAEFRRIEVALMLVLEALCAVCAVAALIAAAQLQLRWGIGFALASFGCLEAAACLDESPAAVA